MPLNEKRHVFTYQTRIFVTPEQDQMLLEYAARFGRVERTLYRDLEKGEDANRLKSSYLVRFSITARQFNAVRVQLQGKAEAIRRQLPVQVANPKRKIGKAKKIVVRLSKRLPGSLQLHQMRRAWLVSHCVSNIWKRSEKAAGCTCASAPRSCSRPSFISKKTAFARMRSGSRLGGRPARTSFSCWVRKTRRQAVRLRGHPQPGRQL